ncbi:MAG: 3-oxoacyl-[acyl-carrier-protein] reductase FabG [Planctomycetes bacterium]|nr:3-oxoacyl-[acyl-carrier-protein] reductase FabG [Planctomycetota bacterium]
MDLRLSDKTVLVTGASGALGRATAEAFAAEGARVALHGHRAAADMEEWLLAQPWRARSMTVEGDVRSPADMQRCVDEVRSAWGRVDACIANAGAWPPGEVRLDECPVERIRETIEVNLLGAMWTARAFMAGLAADGPRKDGHGASLVFIGSTAGRFGERHHADYAAAKAGLVGLARTLKNEITALDPFARVNVVEPGWTIGHKPKPALERPGVVTRVVRTMALRQLGRAEDVARTVVWLASPSASRHVSGEVIAVAGGMEGRLLWDEGDVDEGAVRARLAERD